MSKYYSINEFSKILGVSAQTLRNWDANGKLHPHHTSTNGYRYYSHEQLNQVMNVKPNLNRVTIGYCRVSSHKQKDDLERQIEHVRTYLIAKGQPFEIISDIGSGINYKKKGLKKCLRRKEEHMTTFYFVRHGHMDTSMAGKKFYKDFSYNMMTLSEKGVGQIKETAKDVRLANAELIIASPFGRTLHSAAILSKELNIDMKVETDLHEWLADAVSYDFLPDDIAEKSYKALSENEGRHPIGETCLWESAEQMKKRVMKVLDKYKDFDSVIVVCHGTLMQYVLGIPHPENGQIEVLTY